MNKPTDRELARDTFALVLAAVTNSVLSSRAQIGEGSTLDEAVVLPGARIGSSCHLRRVIIDVGMEIPDGTVVGAGEQVTLPAHDSFLILELADDLRSVA